MNGIEFCGMLARRRKLLAGNPQAGFPMGMPCADTLLIPAILLAKADRPVTAVPEFNDTEIWSIRTTLKERFGENVEVELAETELRLNPHSPELSVCPAVFWSRDNCNFIVMKSAEGRYRCQFFYRLHQMFGTGIGEYDDMTECVVALLQVQADHQLNGNLNS